MSQSSELLGLSSLLWSQQLLGPQLWFPQGASEWSAVVFLRRGVLRERFPLTCVMLGSHSIFLFAVVLFMDVEEPGDYGHHPTAAVVILDEDGFGCAPW